MRRRALLAASSNGESGGFEIDASKYLTIVALEDGVTVKFDRKSTMGYLECYSSRYKRWDYVYNATINTNEYLCFRGNLKPSSEGVGRFSIKGAFALEGNCMSLLFNDDADTHLSLEGYDYCFYYLFYESHNLISVSPKFLPATTLASGCYKGTFKYCSNLTTAPELLATTLADYCYQDTFSLCSKLNYIKALFTTVPSSHYTGMWVYGVASSGTFVKNKNATWNVAGDDGIPKGWTVITE